LPAGFLGEGHSLNTILAQTCSGASSPFPNDDLGVGLAAASDDDHLSQKPKILKGKMPSDEQAARSGGIRPEAHRGPIAGEVLFLFHEFFLPRLSGLGFSP